MAPSFTTQPAFIYYGTWDETTRSHPALRWMEKYTNTIDARIWRSNTEAHRGWLTSDFTLYKADGSIVEGGEKSWTEGMNSIYGPFTDHLHEPNFVANVYVALPGKGNTSSDDGTERPRDLANKEWDAVVPGAFHFEYVKDDKGHGRILLKRTHIFADSGPGMMAMIKRGMLKAQDLGL